MQRIPLQCLALCLLISLPACGGGGSDPSNQDGPPEVLLGTIAFWLSGGGPNPTEPFSFQLRGATVLELGSRSSEPGIQTNAMVRDGDGDAVARIARQISDGEDTSMSVEVKHLGDVLVGADGREKALLVRLRPDADANAVDLAGHTVTGFQCQTSVSHGQLGGYTILGAIGVFGTVEATTADDAERAVGMSLARKAPNGLAFTLPTDVSFGTIDEAAAVVVAQVDDSDVGLFPMVRRDAAIADAFDSLSDLLTNGTADDAYTCLRAPDICIYNRDDNLLWTSSPGSDLQGVEITGYRFHAAESNAMTLRGVTVIYGRVSGP